MNTILLIYIIGVIVALVLWVLELRKQDKVVLGDLLFPLLSSLVVSWLCALWLIGQLYGDVVIYRKKKEEDT
jgi:hypothetical protein